MVTFAPTDAGLLLLPEAGDLSLAVSIPWAGGCDLLNLRSWTLGRAGVSLHVAAKKWSLSLPWTSDDVEWPLEVRPATPEQFIATTGNRRTIKKPDHLAGLFWQRIQLW
jgi:hypothetical protein